MKGFFRRPSGVFLAIALPIILLVTSGFIFLDDFIENKLASALEKQKKNFSCLEYDQLDVSWLAGDVLLTNIHLEKATPADSSTQGSLSTFIPTLKLSGIEWLPLIFSKEVQVGSLVIEGPEVNTAGALKGLFKSRASGSSPGSSSDQGFSIKNILIKRLELRAGKFSWKDSLYDTSVDTIQWSADSIFYSPQTWSLEPNDLTIADVSLTWKDGLHDMVVKRITLEPGDSMLSIDSFMIRPLKPEEFFSHGIERKVTRSDVVFPSIRGVGWDYQRAMQGSLVSRKIELDSFDMEYFIDKNRQHDSTRYRPLPHESIIQLAFPVLIDSLTVSDSKLVYSEIADGKEIPGHVKFDNLDAVFTNITNDSATIAEKPFLDVRATGNFFGEAKVETYFKFDLTDPHFGWTFNGTTKGVRLTLTNPIMAPVAGVKVEEGIADYLYFNGRGDRLTASGDVDFHYSNLDICLLDDELEREKKFLCFLLKTFITKRNNHPDDGKYRKGKMHFERHPSRSFFYLWWHTIQSGLVSTMLPNMLLTDELKHTTVKSED